MTRALSLTVAIAAAGLLSACVPSPWLMPPPQSGGNAPVVTQPETLPPVIPPAAAPKDRLVAAIEQNGCVLTAGNVGNILMRANLTQAELRDLTPQLAAEGRAEVAASGTIRVLTPNCI